MNWRKLGIVYKPDGSNPFASTHAMIPVPVMKDKDTIRVYITCCDKKLVGRPYWVDLKANNPLEIKSVSNSYVLDKGQPGTFDQDGILACSVVSVSDKYFMYYAGFEKCTSIRYRLLTGLAISHDGGETFVRASETPILERQPGELFFRGGPFVLNENGRFRLWYVSGSAWKDINGKQMPVYSIRYMESVDGINWPASGNPSLELEEDDEHGFGRPWVVRSDHGYELYYSIRKISSHSYRLGYAVSSNGQDWERRDSEMGLNVSQTGWDSEAIMYSSVIDVHGKTYCFYNGNNFGEDGFGVAVREESL